MTNPPNSRISGPDPVFDESELVFGLVAPVGTEFDRLVNPLRKILGSFDYQLSEVRISSLFDNFQVEEAPAPTGSGEFQRLNAGMHRGNVLRLESGRGEFLALAAAEAIYRRRRTEANGGVLKRQAHVIRSLKHPDEVRALRRIYGQGFYLVGVSVNEADRRSYLSRSKGCTDSEVDQLLARDEHEEDGRYVDGDGTNYGQRTRDTYHLADVFLPLEDEPQLQRFVNLVFGDPFQTPTQDEHAMFMAFSSALRSADLSRQVGAVVVSSNGDLIATGANDVPRSEGGLYWPTKDDHRDHVLGHDSNATRRDEIIEDILKKLTPSGADVGKWVAEGKQKLKTSDVMDITEYGRAVHAEMEALMSCARNGTNPRGGSLYSTTFPCHSCGKHIVAAGLKRVIYVEPYPKSQVRRLFADSIRLHDQPKDGEDKRVSFEPFTGVGPKRFFDLFSMTLSWGTKMQRKKGGKRFQWTPETSIARVPMLPNSYIDREFAALNELAKLTPKKEFDDVQDP